MKEHEANFEESRYGSVEFVYPGENGGDVDSDLAADAWLNEAIIDAYELESVRSALRFADNMKRWSRTDRAGHLRLLAAQNLIFGDPSVKEIARRNEGDQTESLASDSRGTRPLCALPEISPPPSQ
jgi:hypothetical protein